MSLNYVTEKVGFAVLCLSATADKGVALKNAYLELTAARLYCDTMPPTARALLEKILRGLTRKGKLKYVDGDGLPIGEVGAFENTTNGLQKAMYEEYAPMIWELDSMLHS